MKKKMFPKNALRILSALFMGGAASTTISVGSTVAHAATVKAKSGDTVKDIANKQHMTIQAVAKANHMQGNQQLKKGRKIKIPKSVTAKKGESISVIAQKVGVKTQDLLDANGLTWQDATIQEGQKIALPSKAKAVKTTTATKQTTTSNAQATLSSINNTTAAKIVNLATQIANSGVPYVWGGESMSGFDCSGLTQYVYAQAGINIPRTSEAQAGAVTQKPVSQAQPGDLLFWNEGGDIGHVAIYIGNGQYVQAPQPGQNVQIQSISAFTPSFAGSVR
ncbi:C40 family peptidase [Lactobacillus crispatus]|uniref:Peptidoglycan endopeptidase n=2 Tax=Lactobacillus crispatus TaxID=47770 RepID=A0A4R6CQA9_9LACO|nr:C40 family peptidase [Lactobacillus crispatus]MCT7696769.1 NlpC/P60 family protein [Lactobacillus crispatus]MCT7708243.1 NlpC/P60 family protein [Lactobacillus crispatus]MCZ9662157.1 NlpC/P60 family protein [Lactobacillus crispatus]TDN28920.1 peptidoglycan endopeptidase [Lactobacillus crispatus]UAY40701.1 C40 family peptidase [Lactobacillus crispatus]